MHEHFSKVNVLFLSGYNKKSYIDIYIEPQEKHRHAIMSTEALPPRAVGAAFVAAQQRTSAGADCYILIVSNEE